MKDVLAAESHPQVVAVARPKPIQRQEPGASSRSPLQVQGTKAQGHPLLLSQAKSWELKWKWKNHDNIWHPHGITTHAKQRL